MQSIAKTLDNLFLDAVWIGFCLGRTIFIGLSFLFIGIGLLVILLPLSPLLAIIVLSSLGDVARATPTLVTKACQVFSVALTHGLVPVLVAVTPKITRKKVSEVVDLELDEFDIRGPGFVSRAVLVVNVSMGAFLSLGYALIVLIFPLPSRR